MTKLEQQYLNEFEDLELITEHRFQSMNLEQARKHRNDGEMFEREYQSEFKYTKMLEEEILRRMKGGK